MNKVETIEIDGPVTHTERITTKDSSAEDVTPMEDKKLRRRIDKWLLPVMAVSYMFQFLDKTALSYTSILGLQQDLHLTGSEYSWSSSIYYFGYLVASYPAAILMVRWRVGKLIAAAVLVWGAILMFTALCSNPTGLLANRFFLGISEAPIAPGLSIVVSMWYKRSEQPLRHAAWFLGNTCAGLFGGLLAYGISHIHSMAPWRVIFLIFGGTTVCWSAAVLFLLPDTPLQARFLTKRDREIAILRVKENMTGIKDDKIKKYQVLEALCDVKTWVLFALQLSICIPNGGVSTFSAIIVEGFGFSVFDTLLVTSLAYVLQLILILLATCGSSYLRNTRTYWMAWNYVLSIAGVEMVRQLPVHMKWGRLFGAGLAGSYTANFPLFLSLISGNVGGFTKKTTVTAITFIAYCTGNIIGPQLFFASQQPVYASGFLALLICLVIGFALCFVLRFYLAWENSRRNAVTGIPHEEEQSGTRRWIEVNRLDKTDKENTQFRYVY